MGKLLSVFLILLGVFGFGYSSIVNGSFESGLTGWTVVQGNAEVLQSNNFTPAIPPPPHGSYFLLISNGHGDSPAPDNTPYADMDHDGQPDNDETIVRQTFTTTGGKLCFTWSWLTDEENEPKQYDDIFYVLLDNTIILSGSVQKPLPPQSPFPDIPTDNVSYTVSSPGPTNGSNFGDGRSPFQDFCITVNAGVHTLEFVVADQGNHIVDSGLIIDNVRVEEINLPLIKLSPISSEFTKEGHLDFGEVLVGTQKGPAIVKIENQGSQTVFISGITIEESTIIKMGSSSLNNLNAQGLSPQAGETNYILDLNAGDYPCRTTQFNLGPGNYCTVGIIFAPQSQGRKDAFLSVYPNSPYPEKIYMTGVGVVQTSQPPPEQPAPPSQSTSGSSQTTSGGGGGGCSMSAGVSPVNVLAWLLIPALMILRRLKRG